MVPSLPTPIPHMPKPILAAMPEPEPQCSEPMPLPPIVTTTAPNNFGLFRQYTQFPQVDPEDACTLDDYCNSPNLATNPNPQPWPWWAGMVSVAAGAKEFYEPFLNMTVYCLMSWFYGAVGKSLDDLDKLVHNVLLSPDYDPEHLKNFSAKREGRRMDTATGMAKDSKSATDFFGGTSGWKEGSVKLKVPVEGQAYRDEDQAPMYTVSSIYHHSIVDIIKVAFTEPAAGSFHYIPYKLFWNCASDAPPERVITELYNSDAFLEEHAKLEQQHGSSGSPENAIAAIMLWSDSMHLANFGNATLWPIYCYFGNQSKYDWARPTSFAAHHLAYIPTLPQVFSDWYCRISNNASASHNLLTHMKRELMQAIWLLLLDDEFRIAYIYGIVVKCADGQIKGLGSAADDEIRKEKRKDDATCKCIVEHAQNLIFKSGRGIGSAIVEKLLKPFSMTPTRNAFSICLFEFGFNYHQMFVPDLLHEFELGTWKAAFSYLMRILCTAGDGHIQELNQRYRTVPTFGQSTIRRFSEDAPAMKKLAGRDFEDLLQCSIPVFESLLPDPHNSVVLDLLYSLRTWHALAKLRLSTETTRRFLHIATSQLGDILHKFEEATCAFFYIEKLPTDAAARGQQSARMNSVQQKEKGKAPEKTSSQSFSLATYKLHLLGDYKEAIKMFGTSDSYSTQIGELEHRCVKKFYTRTNKRSTFIWQIAKHERQERLLQGIKANGAAVGTAGDTPSMHLPLDSSEPLGPTPPANHYHISEGHSFPINVTDWLTRNCTDPATKNFLGLLKDHLLECLEGLASGSKSYSAAEWNKLQFASNCIYQYKYMCINYTTYDLQQTQDSINLHTYPDVMVLAANDGDDLSTASDNYPYLYAHILGIFHGDVLWHSNIGVQCMTMHFLWVRWFIHDTSYPCKIENKRLPWLEFATDSAFGFLDLDNVIQGCYLIPAYAFKQVA
ncbi:hypothetical protein AN958_11721 [Leucoagaricus sp. SymC.cos]|nr:hypothetical protein AN958_11721 [Leucoagaricus sp. SymC.cos]